VVKFRLSQNYPFLSIDFSVALIAVKYEIKNQSNHSGFLFSIFRHTIFNYNYARIKCASSLVNLQIESELRQRFETSAMKWYGGSIFIIWHFDFPERSRH